MTNIATSTELSSLMNKSLGDSGVCIAILDGPVDLSHPCFTGANITQLTTLVSGVADGSPASQHGTHVASIIFGQQGSSVQGIAPNCRGLILPIFSSGKGDNLAPCSQIDLARAITQAVEAGANIINISGGQLTASPESDQLLANAVRLCQEKNVLIVAAVGNDGCECLHLPAALESVLAVGAMDSQRNPLDFSNWGKAYQSQGILALGANILGATPGGGTSLKTGTSFATPIVSGIVALLLSIQLQRGEQPDPHGVREAILKSALPCNVQKTDQARCLVGILNISGAYTLITKGEIEPVSDHQLEEAMMEPSEVNNIPQELTTNEINEIEIEQVQPIEAINSSSQEQVQPIEAINPSSQPTVPYSVTGIQAAEAKISPVMPTNTSNTVNPMMVTPNNQAVSSITPSGANGDCGCGGGGPMQIVYAIGQLNTDFGTEARRDSFTQTMPPDMTLVQYLGDRPYEAQSLIFTLNLDATPIYAIMPTGAYANIAYERLVSYLGDESIERISVPGYIGGSIRLMSGQVVPVIIPEVRGMYSWSTNALVESVMPQIEAANITQATLQSRIEDYLTRIYYDYRNLGITPEERALNFSATNAFQASVAIATAAGTDRVLDSISVEKSPICRPDSDCYDVKLRFFDPENNQRSNRVFRFTVDVSDVIPVTIGTVRSWSES
ncbi:PatA/PatG family cyanobactin maturation protease [Okeania sp. KiyG1]|uniref:PatA/PatG family cyanobactin maturation protease n=1 Tax=Okeania sp. KiyG1 TaxID=2720165 RepID=UPI0027DAA24B|nr:PatA/PatG family cyanobactin maturation protease [Okeania sp. KiyG1]